MTSLAGLAKAQAQAWVLLLLLCLVLKGSSEDKVVASQDGIWLTCTLELTDLRTANETIDRLIKVLFDLRDLRNVSMVVQGFIDNVAADISLEKSRLLGVTEVLLGSETYALLAEGGRQKRQKRRVKRGKFSAGLKLLNAVMSSADVATQLADATTGGGQLKEEYTAMPSGLVEKVLMEQKNDGSTSSSNWGMLRLLKTATKKVSDSTFADTPWSDLESLFEDLASAIYKQFGQVIRAGGEDHRIMKELRAQYEHLIGAMKDIEKQSSTTDNLFMSISGLHLEGQRILKHVDMFNVMLADIFGNAKYGHPSKFVFDEQLLEETLAKASDIFHGHRHSLFPQHDVLKVFSLKSCVTFMNKTQVNSVLWLPVTTSDNEYSQFQLEKDMVTLTNRKYITALKWIDYYQKCSMTNSLTLCSIRACNTDRTSKKVKCFRNSDTSYSIVKEDEHEVDISYDCENRPEEVFKIKEKVTVLFVPEDCGMYSTEFFVDRVFRKNTTLKTGKYKRFGTISTSGTMNVSWSDGSMTKESVPHNIRNVIGSATQMNNPTTVEIKEKTPGVNETWIMSKMQDLEREDFYQSIYDYAMITVILALVLIYFVVQLKQLICK